MIHVSEPGLAFALSTLLSAGAAVHELPDAARGPLASVSLIHYRDGCLSALIENRSLAEVLHALGATTGANVILSDPASGEASVSSSFESQSFRAGVMRILEGFSYAIYPVEGEKLPAVLVLSTAPNESPVTGRPSAADGQVPASPVLASPAAFGPSAEQELKNDQTDALAHEQAQREESLNRAIDALTANDGKLDQQALDTLVGVQDPRATQTLIDAVSRASDGRARARATKALRHHAADLEFADGTTVAALEQLANDADAAVQKTARQALEDMKQYRQRNSSP